MSLRISALHGYQFTQEEARLLHLYTSFRRDQIRRMPSVERKAALQEVAARDGDYLRVLGRHPFRSLDGSAIKMDMVLRKGDIFRFLLWVHCVPTPADPLVCVYLEYTPTSSWDALYPDESMESHKCTPDEMAAWAEKVVVSKPGEVLLSSLDGDRERTVFL